MGDPEYARQSPNEIHVVLAVGRDKAPHALQRQDSTCWPNSPAIKGLTQLCSAAVFRAFVRAASAESDFGRESAGNIVLWQNQMKPELTIEARRRSGDTFSQLCCVQH